MKVVFEAGPNAGKTLQLSLMELLGFPVVKERATMVIKSGGPLPWVDHQAFQYDSLCRQIIADLAVARLKGPVLFDRGSPTGIAYCLVQGKPVPDFFRKMVRRRCYDACVLFEAVPVWDADGVRYEEPDLYFTRHIAGVYKWLYQSLDVPVYPLPFGTPSKRTNRLFELMHVSPRDTRHAEMVLRNRLDRIAA